MFSAVAARELRSLFVTPLGWIVFAVTVGLLSYLFLEQVEHYIRLQSRLMALPNAPGITQLVVAQWMGNCAWILMLVIPLITMRTFSEEWRGATMPMLFTSPLSDSALVLGKFCSVLIFFTLLIVVLALLPVSLVLGTEPDWGLIAAGLMGLFLYTAASCAIGIYVSLLTRQPWIAAVATTGVLMLLWIMRGDEAVQREITVYSYLSPAPHFEAFTRGVISAVDISYFLLTCFALLALSVIRFAHMRRVG